VLVRLRAPTRTETTTPAGINLGIGAALVLVAVLAAALIPPVDVDWRFGWSWARWRSSQRWRMTLLVAAGAAGLLVGGAYRQVRAVRSRQRFDATLQVLVTHVDGEEKRDA
jgi:hypothetical protein